MKRTARTFSMVLAVIILLQFVVPVTAAEYENYTTDFVSAQEQAAFLAKINFELSEVPVNTSPISCFAISEQGVIALGFNTEDDAEISVYSSDGQFLYGYRFHNNRCALAIFFEGEDLSIFWGKSGYIGSFDSDGNCLQFQKVINTSLSNDSYHSDRYRPSRGKVGDLQYYADGIGLSSDYTRFTVEDAAGNRTVIYDVTAEYIVRSAICSFIVIIALLLLVIIKIRNKREK